MLCTVVVVVVGTTVGELVAVQGDALGKGRQ